MKPHHPITPPSKQPILQKECKKNKDMNFRTKNQKQTYPTNPNNKRLMDSVLNVPQKFMTTKRISSPLTKILSKPPLNFYRYLRETNTSEIN